MPSLREAFASSGVVCLNIKMIDAQVNNVTNQTSQFETAQSRGSRRILRSSKASSRGLMSEYCNTSGLNQGVQYESKLEQNVYYLLRLEELIIDIREQFPVIPFRDQKGRMRNHTFDFCVTFKDDRKIGIVVKSSRAAKRQRLFDDLHALRAATPKPVLDEIVLITDQDFSKEKALNAERLHRYGRNLCAFIIEQVKEKYRTLKSACSVEEFLSAFDDKHSAFASLLYLQLRNFLNIDADTELQLSTRLNPAETQSC